MSATVLAICGGIGGAKLALGLYRTLDPGALVVAVNTGDDFEHLGLSISPDVDTVLYTLAELADRERGWGRDGETWNFMAALRELGGEEWFQLGDRDLALHVERTRFLRGGRPLSAFIDHVARRLNIAAEIVPMTDDPVRTVVDTDQGVLPFQRYFVERRCAPVVRALRFEGADRARPARRLMALLASRDLRAIIICPSNPYLSIDPILALPGVKDAIARSSSPVVAVSPIIGGQAVKGPTVKIMAELQIPVTNRSIVEHYAELLDGIVIDETDAADASSIELPVFATRTLMQDLADRLRLASEVTTFADRIAKESLAGGKPRANTGMRAS